MINAFIFSSPRSGSTLLSVTLNKFDEVVTLPETHFWVFKDAYKRLNPGKQKELEKIADTWIHYHRIKRLNIDRNALKNKIIADAKSWKDILEITIRHYLASLNIKYDSNLTIIEKSPPHIFYQKEILKDYPQAKKIYLIRDPRAVVGSLRNLSWSTSNIYTLAKSWKYAAQRMIIDNNTLIVKYEHIVNNPANELKRICELLSIPFSEKKLHDKASDDLIIDDAKETSNYAKINKDNINKWKRQLSVIDKEQLIIESVCKKEMNKYGYSISESIKKDVRYYINLFTFFLNHFLVRPFN